MIKHCCWGSATPSFFRGLMVRSVILVMALCLALVAGKQVAAAPPAPVVTTPTPVPTPTPSPLELRRAWLLAGGVAPGRLYFSAVGDTQRERERGAGDGSTHADPASFTYVVQADDTLWSLALDFSRDLEAMSCTTTPTGSPRRP